MPRHVSTADKARRLKEKFRQLDTSHDGKLEFREMLSLLRRGNPSLSERELETLFEALDKNKDGAIDFNEFVEYLYAPCAVQEVHVPADVPIDVGKVFRKYCSASPGAPQMDGKAFLKMCRECDLLGGRLTAQEVDVVFAQVKSKFARNLHEREFMKALTLIAERRGVPLETVYSLVGDAHGPVHRGTQAEAVRFHDDKSTYTGVHAKVAAEMDNHDHQSYKDTLAERIHKERLELQKLERENEIREAKFAAEKPIEPVFLRSNSAPDPDTAPIRTVADDDTDWSLVEPAFHAYCGSNKQMEGSEFLKLLKDCSILDAKLFRFQDVDTTFHRVAGRGQHSIGLEQFQEALKIVAEKKNIAPYFIQAAISSHKTGPEFHGTKPVHQGRKSSAPRLSRA